MLTSKESKVQKLFLNSWNEKKKLKWFIYNIRNEHMFHKKEFLFIKFKKKWLKEWYLIVKIIFIIIQQKIPSQDSWIFKTGVDRFLFLFFFLVYLFIK